MKKGFNFNPITDFTENVIISHHSSAQHIGRRLARQADMGCESSKEDEFQPPNEAASKSTTAPSPLPLPAEATSGAASTASFAEKQKAIALTMQSMQQRQGGRGMRGVKGPGGSMGVGEMYGGGAQMKTGMGDPRSGLPNAHPTPKLTDAEDFATLYRPKAPRQRRPRSATLKPTTRPAGPGGAAG